MPCGGLQRGHPPQSCMKASQAFIPLPRGTFSIPQRGRGTQERIIDSPLPNEGEGAGGEGGLYKLSHSAPKKKIITNPTVSVLDTATILVSR